MPSRTTHRCEFCGRSNFTSQHGLTQHQSTGPCYEALLAERGVPSSPRRLRSNHLNDGVGLPRDVPARPHKEDGMFRRLMEVEDAHVDAIARGISDLLADEEGVLAGSDDEEGETDDEDGASVDCGQ